MPVEISTYICLVDREPEGTSIQWPSGLRSGRVGTQMLMEFRKSYDFWARPDADLENGIEETLLNAARLLQDAALGVLPNKLVNDIGWLVPRPRGPYYDDQAPPEPTDAARNLSKVMNNLGVFYLMQNRRQDSRSSLGIAETLMRDAIPLDAKDLAGVLKNTAAVYLVEADDKTLMPPDLAQEYTDKAERLLRESRSLHPDS